MQSGQFAKITEFCAKLSFSGVAFVKKIFKGINNENKILFPNVQKF